MLTQGRISTMRNSCITLARKQASAPITWSLRNDGFGVKTPEDGNPPPLLGTRFGDPSKFQRLDIPGGFHCGWDVWEKTGAPVLAPLPGTVIESRDRNTVSEDYNMAVQLELRLPRRAE